jgi:AAA family ATP:ADP antiporter
MASINDLSAGSAQDARSIRFLPISRREMPAVVGSFAMFFFVLSAYYIVRPVRDEMGVRLGKDALHQLFSVVFLVMLAAVPLFGLIASRVPRRLVLPALYVFFVADLVLFWVLLRSGADGGPIAAAFFVWASVFNLFVVSLFWSLMSELWSNDEATRIYGVISAGGTAGALTGPLVTGALVHYLNPPDLLLVSAALLSAALIASLVLRRLHPAAAGAEAVPAGGGILDGAARVAASPYLGRIALFVFLANVVGTFFYLEQSRLVGAEIADGVGRVSFFASRDLAVSVVTLLIEIFGTAQVLKRFGVGAALLALPIAATAAIGVLSVHPVLMAVAAVMVAERVLAFSMANPAIKVLYTLVPAGDKYKAQNFIDTVIYRGGDAVSGWIYAGIGAGAGFAAAATPLVALPLAGLWIWNARALGQGYSTRALTAQAPSTPGPS